MANGTTPGPNRTISWQTAIVYLGMLAGNVVIAVTLGGDERVAALVAFNSVVGLVLGSMRGMFSSPALVLVVALSLSGCGGAAALPAVAAAWAVVKPVTCEGARLYERLVCDVPETPATPPPIASTSSGGETEP